MKKSLLAGLLALGTLSSAHAGGLLNNTSLHALYLRSLARNASLAADAAYYNPAGLAFLNDGWRLSLNSQTVLQKRDIEATFAPFAYNGGQASKTFKGTATAPVLPTIMASYKKGDWAFSAVVGLFGGGGKAVFKSGLPQFESQLATVPVITQGIAQRIAPLQQLIAGPSSLSDQQKQAIAQALPLLTGVNRYSVDSRLEGLQYTFGLQLGASYKINQHLSAYLGGRLSYSYNTYSGYIRDVKVNNPQGGMSPAPLQFGAVAAGIAQLQPLLSSPALAPLLPQIQPLLGAPAQLARATADRQIEVKQTGMGFAPIIGLNFNYEGLNIGARYEFRTAIEVKNKTKINSSGLSQFEDGVKTANDMPALLGLGVSYKVLPSLTASVSYNHFFEKQARMAGDKQKTLDHNTNEYLFGLEWNALSWLDVSGGVQVTRKGVTDAYQSNLHFDMSSNSYGLGVGLHLTKEVQLQLAYMISDYKTHTKATSAYQTIQSSGTAIPGSEVYKRKNQIFSIGLDYTL